MILIAILIILLKVNSFPGHADVLNYYLGICWFCGIEIEPPDAQKETDM